MQIQIVTNTTAAGCVVYIDIYRTNALSVI